MVDGIRVLTGLLLLVGCRGEAETQHAIGAIGAIGGSDAVIGVARSGDDAVLAYVCGGETTLQDWTRWFEGTVESDALDLSADGWTLTGAWDGAAWSGELSGPDGASGWSAGSGTDPLVGLYGADDGACTAGVVVTDDGAELSAQGAWCDPDADVLRQVTPVNLILDDGSLTVRVDALDGPYDFSVRPVSP
jgi:hypothetical protein